MVGVVIIDQPLPKPLSSTGFDVVIVFLGRYTAHWLQTDVLAKTNNETYFILTNKLNTVKNEEYEINWSLVNTGWWNVK